MKAVMHSERATLSHIVDMVMGTKCRVHVHIEVYGPYAASRVRFAGLQKPQPALDPASGLALPEAN